MYEEKWVKRKHMEKKVKNKCIWRKREIVHEKQKKLKN